MTRQIILVSIFFVAAAGACAQTIPKSIDKPVGPKQPQKVAANNAAVAREQIMNKRAGHYIFKKKDYLDQKIVYTNGYVDISYRNGKLYIKGELELQYTFSTYQSATRTMKVTKYKDEGPFEWSGNFKRRTEYQGGDTGYLFWNGEEGYVTTAIKSEKGEYVKFYFVEVYEKYVWISTGTQSYTFYK